MFGDALFVSTARGLSTLWFVEDSREASLANLQDDYEKKGWGQGRFFENPALAEGLADRIFCQPERDSSPIKLDIKGSEFQKQVWQFLRQNVPVGETISYQGIAQKMPNRNSERAVGQALARNPVAFLIPCHRVLRKDGDIGDYRWGVERKQAMLEMEKRYARN